jgi:hypothetical protein
VIVRIASEGQYRLPDGDASRLNELDNAVVQAVEAGDEARFRQLLSEMHELVRKDGSQLDAEELTASDVILPPPDTSLEEAAEEFTGDGLIPD